ncbi:hypothetical protein QJS10_CPB19g00617 [Acorus calamus]|uniref:Transmembrane protein n=1 Tax=Acorus calamus TaxID=4465 RepID=A0AAV9CIQ6_ACOCL|nr:hypothetical protein QJS10_CPB19g00617 [Acorus calamus]
MRLTLRQRRRTAGATVLLEMVRVVRYQSVMERKSLQVREMGSKSSSSIRWKIKCQRSTGSESHRTFVSLGGGVIVFFSFYGFSMGLLFYKRSLGL